MSRVPIASRHSRMRVSARSTARWSPAANSTNASADSMSASHQATPANAPPARSAAAASLVRVRSCPGRRRRSSGSGTPSPRAPAARAGAIVAQLSSTSRSASSHCPARNSAKARCACRSARQSSSPRTRYHSSSTAWRARAASKSSIEWKWISGSTLFGASGPALASSSRHCSSSSGRGRLARAGARPRTGRDAIEASAPGARSGIERVHGRVGDARPPAPGRARR